jgi:hypothetical protein
VKAALGALLLCAFAAAAARADDRAVFLRWVHAVPGRARDVVDFETYLRQRGVGNVLPLPQLLLNASHWQSCGAQPYSLPPRTLWPHVVPTLRFIRARVVPALGPVAAVSGYRDPALNTCAGGAPKSAHAEYYALDLVPLRPIARDALIAKVCKLHARYGAAANAGLGFYQGLRFHIDTNGFRRWGSDYHTATSPCVALEEKP